MKIICSIIILALTTAYNPKEDKLFVWSEKQTSKWYVARSWIVGDNFTLSTAIKQIAMWYVETFDWRTVKEEFFPLTNIEFSAKRIKFYNIFFRSA